MSRRSQLRYNVKTAEEEVTHAAEEANRLRTAEAFENAKRAVILLEQARGVLREADPPVYADITAQQRHEDDEPDRKEMLLNAAYHLLMNAKVDMPGGPTDWNETRNRWLEKYHQIKGK